MSPWIDLSDYESPSWMENAAWDFIPPANTAAVAKYYAGGMPLDDPLISPGRADLRDLPPMLVDVGEKEVFFSQILHFVRRARDFDVAVDFHVAPDMCHVYPVFAPLLDRIRTRMNDIE